MSESPCIYVMDKSHKEYPDFLAELDFIHLSYQELIVAELTSTRGTALKMYLSDRFTTPTQTGVVGQWVDVRPQFIADIECFEQGEVPSDMDENSWTVRPQPHFNNQPPYKRLNDKGELELVMELKAFVKHTDAVPIHVDNKVIIRSWW